MALIHLSDVDYTIQDSTKNIYLKLELKSLQAASTTVSNNTTMLVQQSAAFLKAKLGAAQDISQKTPILEVKVDVFKYYIDPGNSELSFSIIESNNDDSAIDQPGTLIKKIDPAVADLQNNIVSYTFDICF